MAQYGMVKLTSDQSIKIGCKCNIWKVNEQIIRGVDEDDDIKHPDFFVPHKQNVKSV